MSEIMKHLEKLKAESEQIKKLVKSPNYVPGNIENILKETEPLRVPQVFIRNKMGQYKTSTIRIQNEMSPTYKSKIPSSDYKNSSMQKQIIFMRDQNMKLQQSNSAYLKQINSLKQQIAKLQQNDFNKPQETIPYFSFKQNLKIHLTRATIPQQNYDEIHYLQGCVSLIQDTLIIQQEQIEKKFDLRQLVNVQYRQKMMILKFEPNKHYVFINFKTVNAKKQATFDLALFVNWKIINTLGSNMKKLFLVQFPPNKRRLTYRYSVPISEKTEEEDEEDEEDKDDNQEKQKQEHQQHKKQYDFDYQKQKRKVFDNHPYNSHQKSTNSPAILIQQQSLKTLENQMNNDFITQLPQTQSLIQKPYEPVEIKQNSEDMHNRIAQSLTKGYTMIKHAKGGIKPHQKHISLDQVNKLLKFKDTDSNKTKNILLKQIKDIKREVGEGIKKHHKNIDHKLCVVLLLTNGNVIQLTAKNQEQINSFVSELKFIINKSIHNYHFS